MGIREIGGISSNHLTKGMKLNKFDQKQLKDLEKGGYEEASLYIILLDLCKDNGVEEVFMLLHNVASDMGQRKELEGLFEKAKGWKWAKYR